jgi:anti-anti-sigma regulatory factor
MTTTGTPTYFEIDAEGAAVALEGVREKLDAGAEITLNFSRITRVEPGVIRALDALARTAKEKPAALTLRGVNVEVYKVLKLARLASQFSFER